MIWYLRRKKMLDKKTSVTLAVKFAEHVLHIYEGNNPGKLAPRKAIESALAWLENPSEQTRLLLLMLLMLMLLMLLMLENWRGNFRQM